METRKRPTSFDESVLHEPEQRRARHGGSVHARAEALHEPQLARGRVLLAEDDIELGAVSPVVAAQVIAEWPA